MELWVESSNVSAYQGRSNKLHLLSVAKLFFCVRFWVRICYSYCCHVKKSWNCVRMEQKKDVKPAAPESLPNNACCTHCGIHNRFYLLFVILVCTGRKCLSIQKINILLVWTWGLGGNVVSSLYSLMCWRTLFWSSIHITLSSSYTPRASVARSSSRLEASDSWLH